MKIGEGLSQGLLGGPALGALLGLADCVRASAEGGTILTPGCWLEVVALHAAIWILPGLLAGLVAGLLFDRAGRAAVLLLVLGTVVFAVIAYVNVVVLPSFTAPESLTFDAVVLTAGILSFFLLYLLPIPLPVPPRSRWTLALALLLVIAALGPLFAGTEEEAEIEVVLEEGERPNVLVFLVDALRSDHLKTYGYGRCTSPNFDAFAERALVFTRCRAASTWTKPSTASIFTGLLPSAHGAVEHREVLVTRAVTMAEVFSAAGYRTSAFSDNPFVSPEFGFDQGFEVFEYQAPSVFVNGTLLGKALWTLRLVSMSGEVMGESLASYEGSAVLRERLLAWLDDLPSDRPWFAYVHAMEPHLPYDPPQPHRGTFADPDYEGPDLDRPPPYMGFLPFERAPALPDDLRRRLVDRYDEEILTWDAEFGALLRDLEARGLAEKTVVVVVADHGEEFYEHGGWTHGHSLHEELLRVPLAMAGPGVEPGRRDDPVRATDLCATLLDLSGIRPLAPLPGRSFLEEGEPGRILPVVSEVAMGGASAAAIVMEGKKLIVSRRGDEVMREAFDLAEDPGEVRGGSLPAWASDHEAALDAILRAARAAALGRETRKLSPQENDALRGLGYTE